MAGKQVFCLILLILLLEIMTIQPGATLPVALPFARHIFHALPVESVKLREKVEINWRDVERPGDTQDRTQRLDTANKAISYWLCTSVKREYYPEDESLPGHTLTIVAPLTVQNLLPVDLELRIHDQIFAIAAGKHSQITSVSMFCFFTDL